ncbi:MAG: hypothetical protein A2315_02265 [Ignavibacteria bacterium RIFOXYB2_FULL_35_12]|nr:MAG: hypothetical protein A2058_03110 [Ignavibacteria bacterium GWA2_36_19]OGU59115.1 MAG: hypothetical protein A2X60_05475 [Ignavibacteria bacterium GWF2_35_20]OGU82037.1 MAG: hypothetical protein A2254_11815 [Ignavibacteria bacterium RIFOXYA2_FULL_35_9]OGU88619.1 MAG: hypothetical protein A3K31_06445 [Ignavibacteria bacterium RIFOXYA12_FULL_35_25]OGU89944.1 MAG: hypothetical protein A2492_14385 [Ignavibacteria bacterium RIFOXYC12_FULL_35_11]OGU94750.1 MAG: hypothetical protein A2347_12380
MQSKIKLQIFGMPIAACDENKTWRAASNMVFRKITDKFGSIVECEYIELYSPESFSHSEVMKLLKENNEKPPYIFINNELVKSNGKLSERVIITEIEKVFLINTKGNT